MLYISEGCQPSNRLYLVDLATLPKHAAGHIDFAQFNMKGSEITLPVVKLIDTFTAAYNYISNDESVILL